MSGPIKAEDPFPTFCVDLFLLKAKGELFLGPDEHHIHLPQSLWFARNIKSGAETSSGRAGQMSE